MDIDLLAKMVGELILEQDEVGLPGIGAFVADVVPASFSDKGFSIHPPYRRLSFRQKKSADDSLAERYASTHGVDLAAAREMIAAFVSEMAKVLKSRKSITFPGLGRLRATKENHFFFVPDESLNIFPDGYGLESISLKSHGIVDEPFDLEVPEVAPAQPAPAESPAGVEAEPAGAAAPRGLHPAWRACLWVAAAALVLLALLAILGRTAPSLVDPLLYNAEELQLLNL